MYPDEYEYDLSDRNSIETAIRNYFLGDLDVQWYKQNDYVNYANKIDASVLIFTHNIETENIQIKSSKYEFSFTVNKTAMFDYLTGRHDLQYLLVASLPYNKAYLFSWDDFVDLANEHLNLWIDKGDYYIIRLSQLQNFIDCATILID